jgi:transposase
MEMSRYIGIDLHRNRFTVCMIAENNRKYFRTVEMKFVESFAKTLRSDDELAVEMTTNTRLFKGIVEKYAGRVVVVDAAKFKVVSESTKKTDKNDSENLAFFLSKDMLPELRMKDAGRERLHSLCQTKDKLTKQRTQLKNKINNVLAGVGILLKREALSSNKALGEVLRLDLDPLMMIELEVIVDQVRSLNRGIARLKKEIVREGEKYDDHKIISSIKGIGKVGASLLLSIIGDVNDFDNEKKLASYFGLVPRVSNSNETQHSGRITKRGSKLGRTTLVQCGLIAKRYSPYLFRFHDRVKQRRGGGKANIALAKKLVGIVYLALKNRWVFTDFTRFEYVDLYSAA